MWHTKEIAQSVLQYPLGGVRELIENKWCRTEPKGKHFIKIVKSIPEHVQKFPIMGMNEKKPKCRFHVSFGQETVRTEPLDSWNCLINCDILKGKIILVIKMGYTGVPWFWEGQVEYFSKLVWTFF